MAPNALGPYYCQINYHSPQAPHSMTLPTKTWNPGVSGGTFDAWSGTPVNAPTMITALVDVFLPFYAADCQFDNYTIFKQLLPTDVPQPVSSATFTAKVGTGVHGGWGSATELQFIARSATFGIAKIVLLDAFTDDDWRPILAFTGDYAGIFGEWGLDANGWQARDNGQVTTPLKVTKNLNQKLRKQYHYD